ncbi:Putative esterase [Mycobacteroides abscessus subsp. abscessus]|nr:Putative esterase [Mycobacteroides abscessus subsp. abscessus]SKK51566.1 Putative esterase [Mycobacteroides abscessus subsp. abscessus]
MVSVRARAFIAAARLQRKKSFYATAAGMRRRLSAHQSAARCEPPRSVRRHRRITRHEVQGHSCYTLHPDGRWDGLHIFHLHGGGFVEQPEKHHWRFADNLVGALRCRYSMFMYPLAPEHDHREITAVPIAK